MALTPDYIDVCHRLAVERRQAGAPTWAMIIDIASILADTRQATNDNPDDDSVRAAAKRIAALVRAKVPASWLDCLSDDYDRKLGELTEEFDDLGEPADIDTLLDGLYDWADINRVWMGGRGAHELEEASGDAAL